VSTTRSILRQWFERGQQQGAHYMIVVCDTFDHEDYPVFVSAADYWEQYDAHDGKNMQRIMESYDLRADVESQLSARRIFTAPPRPAKRTEQRSIHDDSEGTIQVLGKLR